MCQMCVLLVAFITGKTPVVFISSGKFMKLEDLEICELFLHIADR
jgi:hypothetical protein